MQLWAWGQKKTKKRTKGGNPHERQFARKGGKWGFERGKKRHTTKGGLNDKTKLKNYQNC